VRAVSVDLALRYACCALENRLGLVVSLMWVSFSLFRVFNKKWGDVGAVLWCKYYFTSSHLDGKWLSARQPWNMAASQGRDVFSVRCSWAGKNPLGPGDLKGLEELIAHLMRSGFKMLSLLWSSRLSSM